jgi:adenosine deaminase
LYRIVREIIEDYAKQNCVYLELRSTPKALLLKKGGEKGTATEYIDTVLKAIKDGE